MNKPSKIGYLLASDPAMASVEIRDLFKNHKTRRAVARALNVKEETVTRWIHRLHDLGLPYPELKKGRPFSDSKKKPAGHSS